MKRLASLGLMGVLLGGIGVAEQPEPQALHNDFVTVVTELDKASSKRLGLQPTQFSTRDGVMSRREFVAILFDLDKKYSAKYRVTSRPFDTYPDVVAQFNKGVTVDQLINLSRWGMIAPVGPIVVNPGDRMSNEEVGDALGYFFSRVAVYSHQPDPKWTPELQGF